jgi:branched-chain amino acid transport system permease protein
VNQYLLFLVLGLGTGAMYAALAQGMLVAYRGSGVVHLAQGASAMYVAYTFNELRTAGRLVVPPLPNPLALVEGVAGLVGADIDLPDLPTFVDLGSGGLSTPVALLISLGVAALLGLALHVLVFRPLRTAPALAKVVAAVGVIIVLQAIVTLRFGSDARSAEPILPNDPIHMLGGVVQTDRLLLAAIALVTAGLLWALFRFTVFGLATRAAAGNEKGAVLLGYSPDRLASLCWVLSTVLAGLMGILTAPIVTLEPNVLTFLVIPALGAVLLARWESVLVATAAGLLLGMLDQLLVLLVTKPQFDWLPEAGTREALPFLIIVVALFVRGRSLPGRGTSDSTWLPRSPEPRRVARLCGVLLAVLVAGQFALGYEWRQALTVSCIGAVISLSLVVVTGLVGQISLSQMALAGVSAFLLTRLAGEWGVPFPIASLLAALASAGVGLLVAVPAVRIRGINLAVVTLGFAYAVDQLVFNNTDLVGLSADAPSAGSPGLFGLEFGPLDHLGSRGVPSAVFGVFVAAVTVAAVGAIANLRRSATGRRMLAVRANERAAASVGIDLTRTKLLAFGLSAFLAGLAGGLLAYQNAGRVEPSTFAVFVSLTALATAYLGGIASIAGALTAGVLTAGGLGTVVLDRVLHMGQWEQLAVGCLLVVTAVLNPEGIANGVSHSVHHLRRHRSPAPAVEPSPVGSHA